MSEVFVDPSGRRRRFARYAGIAVGCLLVAYMAVVAAGLFTGSYEPFTPWPGRTPQAAQPGNGGVTLPSHSPSRRASHRPATSPQPPTHSTAASPRRTVTPSATGRDHGRGYGLTKSPNPRKPSG